MSYSNPHYVTYVKAGVDFADAAFAWALKAPYGYSKGRLIDVGVAVTETFNQVTTPAYLRIGTASDADAYAQLNMAAAADTNFWNTQDDTDAIIVADIDSTQIEVAAIANTGGTPAGKGDVHITVAWFA